MYLPFSMSVVSIDYFDLEKKIDLSDSIRQAFGSNGLGILIVSNIPGILDKRSALLPYGQKFYNLPEDVKQSFMDKDSSFQFGWSEGNEFLDKEKTIADTSKSGFYANPTIDVPTVDEFTIKKYPGLARPNIWPDENILPGFKSHYLNLAQQIHSVGLLIAEQCDIFIHNTLKSYGIDPLSMLNLPSLHKILHESLSSKSRILHYSQPKKFHKIQNVSKLWCNEHTDIGALTGLTNALWLDEEFNTVTKPDDKCGLYIRDKNNDEIQIIIPTDCIAFQIGKTAQILSGGLLKATPHFVKAPESSMNWTSRNTLAVFCQPNWDAELTCPDIPGVNKSDINFNPWRNGFTFSDLLAAVMVNSYNMDEEDKVSDTSTTD